MMDEYENIEQHAREHAEFIVANGACWKCAHTHSAELQAEVKHQSERATVFREARDLYFTEGKETRKQRDALALEGRGILNWLDQGSLSNTDPPYEQMKRVLAALDAKEK